MLLRSLRASKFFTPYYFNKRPFSVFSHESTKHIDVTIREGYLSLTFQISGERPINFFVTPEMSFKDLQGEIETQYPGADLEFEFPKTKKALDLDSNIVDFLNLETGAQVNIAVNQDNFALKNTMAEPLAKAVVPILKENVEDPNSIMHWFASNLKNDVPPSHAHTLSYLLKNFNQALNQHKNKGKLTEPEIVELMKKSMVFGCEPIDRKLEECYHELNIVKAQIRDLEAERDEIEGKAEKKINLYIKLILLATLAQFLSFYYAIFHVDWLGWDIIEPITYTVQCLTVVFGLRFYLKHGMGRDLQAIKLLNRNKIINKDKLVKARYQILNQQLAHKERTRDLLKLQKELYLNRRNYYQFFFSDSLNTNQTS